jgi:dolichyl-phosphate beta-glucosyltransferase
MLELLAVGHVPVSIVIPTYKERVRLPRTLREVSDFLIQTFDDFEILVVDDDSPDGTRDVIFDPAEKVPPELLRRVKVINQPGRLGKGAAIRRGFEESRGEIVMFMDADHATRIEYLPEAMQPILRGQAEGVVGLRVVPHDELMRRRIISLGLLWLAHVVALRKPVMDSQCGFKIFSRRVAQDLARYCRVDTGLIDVEIFTLLQKWNVGYGYVSVDWNNDPDSRIEIVRTVIRDIAVLFRIAVDHRLGRYDVPLAQRIWERKAIEQLQASGSPIEFARGGQAVNDQATHS